MLDIEELLSVFSFHSTKKQDICRAAAATELFQIGVIWRWVQFIFQNLRIILSIFQTREKAQTFPSFEWHDCQKGKLGEVLFCLYKLKSTWNKGLPQTCAVQMKPTKNQVSTNTWKNDSGTETSLGTSYDDGKIFSDYPSLKSFFPQLITTWYLKGFSPLPYFPQAAAALSFCGGYQMVHAVWHHYFKQCILKMKWCA